MSIFDVISLLGGLAMFLFGMRLMGDSLKQNSSGTLKKAMSKVTDNPVKAFVLGVLVTALIQSSTATIVITSGLVGAGILSLHQSLGIIIGANVGTTVTGQIIRLLDVDASKASWLRFLQPSTLAPIALIIGIILIMSNFVKNSRSIGNIAIGFGILFSGLLNMTGAVNSLANSGIIEELFSGLGENPFLGYITGAGVAFALQSSSATIGILQAFSSTGLLTFKAIYSVIVGIYLGDCVTTAIVCSIGAKADAKRVGIVNILFNLSETVLVLAVVITIHRMGLLDSLWDRPVNSSIIANTNTIFNMGCSIVLFPMLGVYEKMSLKIIKDEPEAEDRYKAELDALNPVFFNTPALALQSSYNMLLTMFRAARDNIDRAFRLLENYDPKLHKEILDNEDDIDRLTDRLSNYTVELLPHLRLDHHVNILNQYYKVTNEFERLGDSAVKISGHMEDLARLDIHLSETAISELAVLKAAVMNILDETERAFRNRDIDAAYRIEPMVQIISEMVTLLKQNHLLRMSRGECNVYADSSYGDIMMEINGIARICSNVGIATVIRVHPEMADHEHLYFERLHDGGDYEFDEAYRRAHDLYFPLLNRDMSDGAQVSMF